MTNADKQWLAALVALFFELLCHKLPPGADDQQRIGQLRDFWKANQ